jgi:hypothetical protein
MKNNHNNRKGLALAVILFFAFAIGIILFTMIKSNSNLSMQNKNTIRALQAHYLTQSAMQHAKLHLNLLPRETYEFFQANKYSTDSLNYIVSNLIVPVNLNSGGWDKRMSSYDLFNPSKCDPRDTPFGGSYEVTSTECLSIESDAKLIQDVYKVKVKASVTVGTFTSEDELEEEFSISRYSGG